MIDAQCLTLIAECSLLNAQCSLPAAHCSYLISRRALLSSQCSVYMYPVQSTALLCSTAIDCSSSDGLISMCSSLPPISSSCACCEQVETWLFCSLSVSVVWSVSVFCLFCLLLSRLSSVCLLSVFCLLFLQSSVFCLQSSVFCFPSFHRLFCLPSSLVALCLTCLFAFPRYSLVPRLLVLSILSPASTLAPQRRPRRLYS